MIGKREITISLIIFICGILIVLNIIFSPIKIFDYYCKTGGDNAIYSINTHGKENVNISYLYLYNKGVKINHLLESEFFDKTQTNIFFNGVRLKKGDVAWFLYSDINFNDTIYNKLLSRNNFITGTELFLETIKNPLLRNEFLDLYKTLSDREVSSYK